MCVTLKTYKLTSGLKFCSPQQWCPKTAVVDRCIFLRSGSGKGLQLWSVFWHIIDGNFANILSTGNMEDRHSNSLFNNTHHAYIWMISHFSVSFCKSTIFKKTATFCFLRYGFLRKNQVVNSADPSQE